MWLDQDRTGRQLARHAGGVVRSTTVRERESAIQDQVALADDVLAARVAGGDQRAYAVLVERYYGRALGIAGRILTDRTAAEDAVQEGFLRLWTRATSFDPGKAALKTWLMRIIVNQCLDRKRAMRPVEDIDGAGEIADASPDPEAQAIAGRQARVLGHALDDLPTRQRAALTLFYGEGLTMAEVADIMETPTKAVESLLSRGRAGLKSRLEAQKEHLL